MIIWHGWADPLVTAAKTVAWHVTLGETIGNKAREEIISLHMIPGLDHCGLPVGPAGITQADLNSLAAMAAWLDTGVPPETLQAKLE